MKAVSTAVPPQGNKQDNVFLPSHWEMGEGTPEGKKRKLLDSLSRFLSVCCEFIIGLFIFHP